ncbi:MAG: hypothetical protein JEZ00_06350 [Anaerolineaceae bacterium]|nr:hypothetical protein [Anaerolineaceae bacterium]
MEQENKSDFAQRAGEFVEEIFQLSIDAGKQGLEYLKSINHIVIMNFDEETIALLDKIVNADIAKSRRDAVKKFMDYGFEFRKDIVDKINATEQEIEHLKQQIIEQNPQATTNA